MAKCPKCGVALLEDSGLVTCHACGTFAIIDENGNALMDDGGSSKEAAAPAPAVTLPMDPLDYLGGLETPIATFHASPFHDAPAGEASVEPHFGELNSHDLDGLAPASMDSHQGPYDSPTSTTSDGPTSEYQEGMAFQNPDNYGLPQDSSPMLSEDDPLGLNAYANSEVSAANDGMLVCRILIDGIDTKEIRDTLRAAMNDQRFNWDQNEILSHLKSGHLVIENVTPVKAMVLIKRIKQMPVRIRWEQHTIAEVEEDLGPAPTDLDAP